MSIFDIFKKNPKNDKLYAAIKALEKSEILMMPQENASVKHPGASKIGGKPYLPADFVWPTFTDSDDNVTRPLSFFCQINLAEVKSFDKEGVLPGRGMLYFFYECESMKWGFDAADNGAARVFWFDTTDLLNCVPLDIPEDIAEEYVIPEIALQFKARKSYPKFEEFEVYSDLEPDWEEYDEVLEKLGVNIDEDPEEQEYEEQAYRPADELSLKEANMGLIEKVLQKHNGNRKAAAVELGISERTLYRKIKQMNR